VNPTGGEQRAEQCGWSGRSVEGAGEKGVSPSSYSVK